jgi:hypothetical protein
MFDFLNNIFSKRDKIDSKSWIESVKRVSSLSHDINQKINELTEVETELFMKNKKDLFISVPDFLELLQRDEKVTVKDIFKLCKHVSEISSDKSSVIEVYTIVEDDHIVLCSDLKNCEKHKNYKGEKIKIVSARI